MKIQHAGTELLLVICERKDGYGFTIEVTGENKSSIMIEKKSKIDFICPSIEGTVVLCVLKSGEERFYDSRTGNCLSIDDVMARNPTFYA